jgi:hypothetical protein
VSIFSRSSEDKSALRWAALGVLVLVVLFAGWLGLTGLSAKSNLEKARQSAQQVKDALLKGESDAAAQAAESAVAHAQSARSAAHSVPWNIAAAMPFLGKPFKTGQQMSDVVVGLATDILRPAAKAGIGLSPSKLYSNGRIDVQLLRQQEPELRSLADSAAKLDTQAAAISPSDFLPQITNARRQLRDQTVALSTLLRDSALAAQIGPAMMGADGPRAYLLAFQTNAEARGTGGLIGGTGILRFDNGKPTIDTLQPNSELYEARADIDLGPEFNDVYGSSRPYADIRNSNQSSHFPYAAQIWKSMWERQGGAKVDGVIALDPVALSYILRAVGDVTAPDGQVVSADNVVELTESTTYIKFPRAEDQAERKKYLQGIANAVVRAMTEQVKSPGKLLDALGHATSERRIAVWSAFPDEQKVLEQTPLAHVVPDDAAPYAEVVINNFGGNKMDYYLKREIEFAADGCSGDMRNSTVTVRLTNTLGDAKGLPVYVAGSEGLPPDLPVKFPPGTMISSVRVIATKNAKLTGLTANGERAAAISKAERGHPAFEIQVVIPPGQSGELVFQLSEPTSKGEARVPVQPLIDPVNPAVSVPTCP